MKVAILSFYSGEIYRGVETFVHELSNRLVKLGVDVTVYQNGPKHADSIYKTQTINLPITWPKADEHYFTDYYAKRVKKFTETVLKKVDKDTDIIFPTNGQWQSVLCRLWALKNKKKIIISGQSGPGMDDRINLYSFPHKFIALTNTQATWATKNNPLVATEVIPNGVDVSKYSKSKKKINFGLHHPIILSVGALTKNKRHDLVIRAVAKLKNVSLLIVGKGDEESNIKDMCDEYLPGRYKITSFKFSDMPSVYSSCDVFTFPTVPWESFGIVMLEAMASGLSLVVSDDPIRREIVGDAGYFVDPTNSDEYAKSLKKALLEKSNIKEKMLRCVSKYDWNNIAQMYYTLFQKLMK